jgi:hypothetical protein
METQDLKNLMNEYLNGSDGPTRLIFDGVQLVEAK